MRTLILPCCIALLTACSNSHEPQQEKTAAANPNLHSYSGSINNKIPVSLWYTMQDSILSGELVYTNTKGKKPIRIIGFIRPDGISLEEFLPDGNITGSWYGNISGNSFKGKWSAPGSDKELDFILNKSENSNSATEDQFTAGDITGSYDYNYNKGENGMGTLDVKKTDDRHIIYNISAAASAPGYNQATVDDDTLELKGNEATYSSKDELGTCSYRIRFYKDFVVVDSPLDEYECGFGMGATVTGIYIKTGKTFTSMHFE